uniref:Uncharacterized protein n=1 Tax=Schistosoma mansoni TaxID=6183 RepID=A0A5K4F5W3_SCHMA
MLYVRSSPSPDNSHASTSHHETIPNVMSCGKQVVKDISSSNYDLNQTEGGNTDITMLRCHVCPND